LFGLTLMIKIQLTFKIYNWYFLFWSKFAAFVLNILMWWKWKIQVYF
jgi:hypothetical protein